MNVMNVHSQQNKLNKVNVQYGKSNLKLEYINLLTRDNGLA